MESRIHDCLGFPSSLFGNKIISVESIVGLHVAAHDLGIPWIIIKGVSDHKDGRKYGTDCWKKFASLMATSLTVYILRETGPTILRQVSTTTNYPRLEYFTRVHPLNLSV